MFDYFPVCLELYVLVARIDFPVSVAQGIISQVSQTTEFADVFRGGFFRRHHDLKEFPVDIPFSFIL